MNIKKIFKELVPYIVILIVVVIIRTFLVSPVRVDGDSMLETLKEGNILILNKFDNTYKRFDIVVLDNSVIGKAAIKRIIGMPGEEIEIENGNLYINKQKFEDPYNNFFMSDLDSVTLKGDEYFVMGDNREVSFDSRGFGPVHKKNLSGTVTFGVWPLGKIK